MSVHRVLKGLTILAKYDNHFHAEHDQIWVGPAEAGSVPNPDGQSLLEQGWFVDDDSGCWSLYI